MTICSFADLSTIHLTQWDVVGLDDWSVGDRGGHPTTCKYPEGWIMSVWELENHDVYWDFSPTFRDMMATLNHDGCILVRFDADAPQDKRFVVHNSEWGREA